MIALTSYSAIQANLDGAAISTYVPMMLLVPMRIWCRLARGGRRTLGVDDLLAVIALLVNNGFFFTCMIGLKPNLGKTAFKVVPENQVIAFLRDLFVAQLFYTWCIFFNKICILAFYWRLFSVKSRIPILIAVAVVSAWAIAITLCVIFTCNPVSAQWDLTITDKKCIETRDVWLGGSVPNVVTDIALIVLPLPYVWQLNAPVAQKVAVAGMLLLGCFVSVVSIVRLSIMMTLDLTSTNVTVEFTEVVIWSVVEINCGLICACLPSLRPALSILGLNRIFGIGSKSGSHSGPSHLNTPGDGSDNGVLRPYRKQSRKDDTLFTTDSELFKTTYKGDDEEDSYEMIKRAQQEYGQTTTHVEPARSSTSMDRYEHLPPGIAVKRDWHVSAEHGNGHTL